jgi:hypothetical protein
MRRNSVVLHTALSPDVVADCLHQSVETTSVSPWSVLLLIRVLVTIASWVTGPPWNDTCRQVMTQVSGKTFRLERRRGTPFSSAFYGSWEAEHGGTKIEGYFRLPSRVLITLRVWLFIMGTMAVIGVVVNMLDLTVKTHFTVDPDVGLTISICLLLLPIGVYLLAQWLGSRRDAGSLAYLEQKLAGTCEDL